MQSTAADNVTQKENLNERTDSTDTVDTESVDSSEHVNSADPDRSEPAPSEMHELSSLRAEVAGLKDKLVRQAAEFQNFRRRTETEKSQMVGFGKSFVLQQLLDVFDDLYRSVEAANETGDLDSSPQNPNRFESLKSGVELAHQKLMDELQKLDVHVIETVGCEFDEELHEAIMQQEAPEDTQSGTILAEVQRGFKMGDRVLRHAKVIVAS